MSKYVKATKLDNRDPRTHYINVDTIARVEVNLYPNEKWRAIFVTTNGAHSYAIAETDSEYDAEVKAKAFLDRIGWSES